jgi:FAD/FMN-containing dehydrogenase
MGNPSLPKTPRSLSILSSARYAAMEVCRDAGVHVGNPHTYVLEDGGQVNNIARILAWKRQLDPGNLLNPGKLRSVV